MAKRSSSPPLYELMRTRGLERESPPPAPPPPKAVRESHHSPGGRWASLPGSWLRPGRTLHMPVGYLFIAAALMIVLMAASYMIGHRRGEARALYVEADDAAFIAGTPAAVPRDPLDPAAGNRQPPPTTRQPERRQPSADSRSGTWGPIFSDPTEPGLAYLVLMETNRNGAERFAEFARDRGLETYAIGRAGRNFLVIAAPGFEDERSAEARAFRENVLRIGRAWREQERGARDLGDSYFRRFRTGN